MLYLNVPGTGVLIFDRFGNFSKTLALEVPSFFQVTDQFLYYLKDGELFSYDLRTAEMALLELPGSYEIDRVNFSAANSILDAELQPGKLFIFTGKGYQVYHVK